VDVSSGARTGLRLRHATWYIDSERAGRVWLGQHSMATDNLIYVNSGGFGGISGEDPGLIGGGMFLRPTGATDTTGLLANQDWGDYLPSFDQPRADIIRYDSPEILGCVLSTSWGENDQWDVAGRCRQQLNSVEVVFGVGYIEKGTEGSHDLSIPATNEHTDVSDVIVSGGVKHEPTGLFVSSHYANRDFGGGHTAGTVAGATRPDVERWYVAAGINRRFNSLGKTTIFGEYGSYDDANAGTSPAGFTAANTVISSTDTEHWGVGVLQNIDSAAMELSIGYRNYSLDVTTDVVGGGSAVNESVEDLDLFLVQGRIKF
jgi:hypothetical protein